MPEEAKSPITRRRVPYVIPIEGAAGYTYKHSLNDGFADLVLSEGAAMRLKHGEPYSYDWERSATPEQTRAALDLLRSYLWRVHRGFVPPFIVVSEGDDEPSEFLKSRGLNLVPFERFITEAEALTFVDKANETLSNILAEQKRTGQYVPVPYAFTPADGWDKSGGIVKFGFNPRPNEIESGICYGCGVQEAPDVLDYLQKHGYIAPERRGNGLGVTGDGRAHVDTIKRVSRAASKSAFFIRRWDPKVDPFFSLVMNEVKAQTGVDIQPVWGERHNERIDNRILRKIEESAFCVLDISERFNVGYEAGWAMRLGKTIIAIRQKPKRRKAPPFDITTLNTFDYTLDNPEALIEDLVERVKVAQQELADKSII